MPLAQKLWVLRKFYAGNGGCLPPTDPRILSMTLDQIELEFAFIAYDKEMAKGSNYYKDPEYAEYEKEIEEEARQNAGYKPPPANIPDDEDEWEDI